MPEWAQWVSEATVEAFRAEYMPELPPLDGGEYLIGYLLDAGPSVAGAMGAGPLTSGHLLHWQQETGINLSPWEARTLRRLSIVWLNEQHQAEKRAAQAPWRPVDSKPEMSDTQAAIRSLARL